MSQDEPFDAMDYVRRRIAESLGVSEEMLRNREPNRALALQALEAQRERHRQDARPGEPQPERTEET